MAPSLETMWSGSLHATAALLALAMAMPTAAQDDGMPNDMRNWKCLHCNVDQGFDEFLKPEAAVQEGEVASEVHVMWPTHVEVVSTTSDNGGWEPPSFHKRLAQEAVRGWRAFQNKIVPSLKKNHDLRRQMNSGHAGALNDAFFHWQKKLFEDSGDVKKSLQENQGPIQTPPPDANSSWPEMNGLPEYQKLRQIVEKLSRRYLQRSGMDPEQVRNLNYSIFNWAAVHGPGEFHGPHTHVGEYHVAVFYAQAGRSAGKLRFGDPRGHSPPFGRSFFHTPRSGDLIIFPSWLNHMATVTSASSDLPAAAEEEDKLRVVFSFNIGPLMGPLPCHLWFSDPTGDMRFSRRSSFDPRAMGLQES